MPEAPMVILVMPGWELPWLMLREALELAFDSVEDEWKLLERLVMVSLDTWR